MRRRRENAPPAGPAAAVVRGDRGLHRRSVPRLKADASEHGADLRSQAQSRPDSAPLEGQPARRARFGRTCWPRWQCWISRCTRIAGFARVTRSARITRLARIAGFTRYARRQQQRARQPRPSGDGQQSRTGPWQRRKPLMPSKTPKQKRTMAAAAHNPAFAKKLNIPVKVAKEFNAADKGKPPPKKGGRK